MNAEELSGALPTTALAFRGYNNTNLGKSRELFEQPAFQPIVARHLREVGAAASEHLGRLVDLVTRIELGQETTIDTYADAVALIVAMEQAQLEISREHFGLDLRQAKFSFGYSLGEIAALVAGGVIEAGDALRIPLSLADDCAALAADATLGVLFTRAMELPLDDIRGACLRVNLQGRGVVGISSILAPNSLLLIGQGDTLDRFLELARGGGKERLHLRKNEHRWPPLHTPIMWERNIPNRAARLMHTLPLASEVPRPNVLSLVTGHFSHTPTATRDLLHRWVDHPQRLWDGLYAVLSGGIKTVIHVGPEPNLIPATFKRLAENVAAQKAHSMSLRALSAAARRTWLKRLLPERAALLRAPDVQHVILEDWLLEKAPGGRSSR
jgi:[acyl-carrier-protein] S-malonyltransferase